MKLKRIVFVLTALITILLTLSFLNRGCSSLKKNFHKIDVIDSIEKLQDVKYKIDKPLIIKSIKNGELISIENGIKNKLIFLNIWAPYCKPCIEEFLIFEKIIPKYKNKMQFYFLSIGDSFKTKEIINRNKFKLDFFLPTNSSPITNTQILPLSYILINDTIIKRFVGIQNWDSIFINLTK